MQNEIKNKVWDGPAVIFVWTLLLPALLMSIQPTRIDDNRDFNIERFWATTEAVYVLAFRARFAKTQFTPAGFLRSSLLRIRPIGTPALIFLWD